MIAALRRGRRSFSNAEGQGSQKARSLPAQRAGYMAQSAGDPDPTPLAIPALPALKYSLLPLLPLLPRRLITRGRRNGVAMAGLRYTRRGASFDIGAATMLAGGTRMVVPVFRIARQF